MFDSETQLLEIFVINLISKDIEIFCIYTEKKILYQIYSIFAKSIYIIDSNQYSIECLLSKSESVKFSLIESVLFLITDSSMKTIFFTVKSVNFN